MSKPISRRTFLKKSVGTMAAFIGVGSGGYYYAKNIEPMLVEITKHTIKHKLVPTGFDGLTLVQFSDSHLGFHYTLDQFQKLIEKMNGLQPDIVCFTGDLIDEPNRYPFNEQLPELLSQIKAPLGKYCIYGNHDHGGYGSDIYKKIMEASGFKLLVNSTQKIELIDGSYLNIAGIDDAMLGRPDLHTTLHSIPRDDYTILLSHAPDLADYAAQYPVNLQLSGHSHGGQIKLPFYGALVTPPYAVNYHEGFYQIENNSDPLTLYVNRGLGTTRLPFRFLSKPELTLFTFQKDT